MPQPNRYAAISAAALDAFIAQLEKQRSDIDAQITEAQEARKYQQRQCSSAGREATGPRRKKGVVLERLREFYAAKPGMGYTIGELATFLGLPKSSIQNVLKKRETALEFIQGGDGRWKQGGLAA